MEETFFTFLEGMMFLANAITKRKLFLRKKFLKLTTAQKKFGLRVNLQLVAFQILLYSLSLWYQK